MEIVTSNENRNYTNENRNYTLA